MQSGEERPEDRVRPVREEPLFATDDLRGEVHSRAARSGVVQISGQVIQIAGFAVSAMLFARLLSPADFGLFAMASTVTVVTGTVRDFGLPMATVYHEELDRRKLDALFWLSVKLSFALFCFLLLTAPLIAWFYGDARIMPLAMVNALGTLGLGLSVQHESLLIRRMNFRALRAIDIVAMVGSLSSGLLLAAAGAGYWALACQLVISELLRASGNWIACNWRPSWAGAGSTDDLKGHFRYAADFTAYQALMKLVRHIDRVLVGYFAGAGTAGYYFNAQRWAMYPINQVFPPLLSVAVSGLSRLRDNSGAFRDGFRKGTLLVLSVVVPVLSFAALEARNTVLVVMGAKWEPSVPIFQLMCIAALAICVERLSKWLFLAQGDTRRQLVWGFIYAPILVVCVTVGMRWGAVGAAAGFAIGSWLLLLPGVAFCLARSHVRWSDMGAVAWRPAAASIIAATGTYFTLGMHPSSTALAGLFISGLTFGTLYLAAWVVLPGGFPAARNTLSIIASLRASRPQLSKG